MRFRDLVLILFAFVIFSSVTSAQTQPADKGEPDKKSEKDADADKEKEKKKKEMDEHILQILDAAIADAATLRLPENRAIVDAMAGDLYWKYDEKRSRELFRNSAAEILSFNLDSDKEKRESTDPYFQLFDSNDVRSQVLPLIAKHDAELALELLLQTRPAKLAEAMVKASQPNSKTDSGYLSFDPQTYRVRAEIALEQQFALLVADENPEKAIKLIKDSLAKGVSWNVMPLLQKLNKKDEKKAGELAGDVIKKLVDTDLTKKGDELEAALRFLQYATTPAPTVPPKEKPFKFSEAQTKDLANKLADTLLQPSKSLTMTMVLNRAIPMLEKILPDRAALLRQREAENQGSLPPEVKNMQQQEKLWDANSTPEDILTMLPKLQNEMEKATAYQSLSMKISQIDDDARAKKLIDQIPDDKARETARERYESARISRTASAGNLDEARKQIGNLTKKKTQIQKLVALAIEFKKKGTEKDTETAKGLMKDAKALSSESPEDEDELNDLMEIVKGYAVVEPDIAFRLFEPIVDQINDFVQASAILSKYNKRSRSFKKGELVMKTNGSSWDSLLIFRYMGQIQLLGKADLDRMNVFSDRFVRADSRTLVKLFVIQGNMKDDKKPDEPIYSEGMIFMDDN